MCKDKTVGEARGSGGSGVQSKGPGIARPSRLNPGLRRLSALENVSKMNVKRDIGKSKETLKRDLQSRVELRPLFAPHSISIYIYISYMYVLVPAVLCCEVDKGARQRVLNSIFICMYFLYVRYLTCTICIFLCV